MAYIPVFATEPTDLTRNKSINVENLSAFGTPSGRTYTLIDGTSYNITKDFDWSDSLFIIPDNSDVSFTTSSAVSNGIKTTISGSDVLFSGAIGRVIFDGVDITSTGGGKCFNFTAGVNVVPFLTLNEQRITGFDAIGDLDGLSIALENAASISNGAGWVWNNMGTVNVREQVFVSQTGDHITITGTAANIIFRDIVGEPSTGDQIFNLDAVTVSGLTSIFNVLFTGVNGGTTGLIKTYTADQTLDNIFTDIRVDTASNVVEIELPDISISTIPEGYPIDITDTGNAGTNYITVIPNASDGTTINNGLTRYRITEDNGSVIVQRHGSTWEIINRFNQKSISAPLTATSTLTELDDVTLADTSGGVFTTTVPTAVGRRGKFFVLKKLQGNAAVWTVVGTGGETFDNAAAINFVGAVGKAATIMSDGTNWIIIEAV